MHMAFIPVPDGLIWHSNESHMHFPARHIHTIYYISQFPNMTQLFLNDGIYLNGLFLLTYVEEHGIES